MCVDCIRNEVDITEGIPKQLTLYWCKVPLAHTHTLHPFVCVNLPFYL